MRHANSVDRFSIAFPRCDPERVIEEYRERCEPSAEHDCDESGRVRPVTCARPGDTPLTYDETKLLAHETLVALGPEPFPLVQSLRKLVHHDHELRRQDLAFRKATEIELPQLLPVQNPWIINTNFQFHLGVSEINMDAWAKMLKLPLHSNNSCFRSLDSCMLYQVAGDHCVMNAKIYHQGTVVMIGVRPTECAVSCAHQLVLSLREQGIDCSVNGLTVNNIVVGFDLGESLNLEMMLATYPERLQKDHSLPMLTYFRADGSRTRAFLFRTGRGLMPGVKSHKMASELLIEIYREAQPFLYHGNDVMENNEIVAVTGMVQDNADIEEVLHYIETTRPDMIDARCGLLPSDMHDLLEGLQDDDDDMMV